MRKLVEVCSSLRAWDRDWQVPTASALCQARQRLGEEPYARAVRAGRATDASPAGRRAWIRGWRVMALDGVIIDMPDTRENAAAFGRTGNRSAEEPISAGPYRWCSLECGSRAAVSPRTAMPRQGERELARGCCRRIDDAMLITGRPRVLRLRDLAGPPGQPAPQLALAGQPTVRCRSRPLPDGSYLSASAPKQHAQRQSPAAAAPTHEQLEVPVRVVEYAITNRGNEQPAGHGRTRDGPTGHIDPGPGTAPAVELAALYHDRWEIELAFDEIETHQIGSPRVLDRESPASLTRDLGAAADPLRGPAPDVRSRRRHRRRSRPNLIHPHAADHPSPGHRPGGIFPQQTSQRSRQRSLKSPKGSTRSGETGPAHEPSRRNAYGRTAPTTRLQDHQPRPTSRDQNAQSHRITERHWVPTHLARPHPNTPPQHHPPHRHRLQPIHPNRDGPLVRREHFAGARRRVARAVAETSVAAAGSQPCRFTAVPVHSRAG